MKRASAAYVHQDVFTVNPEYFVCMKFSYIVRESAAVSDCTKISCVRKVGEFRIRKLSAYEIFWIYSMLREGSTYVPRRGRLLQELLAEGHLKKLTFQLSSTVTDFQHQVREAFFACMHQCQRW